MHGTNMADIINLTKYRTPATSFINLDRIAIKLRVGRVDAHALGTNWPGATLVECRVVSSANK